MNKNIKLLDFRQNNNVNNINEGFKKLKDLLQIQIQFIIPFYITMEIIIIIQFFNIKKFK